MSGPDNPVARRRRLASATATLLAVAALVLTACSGVDGNPARDSQPQAVEPTPIPTVVVLDASDSMNTADAPGPRIDAAKAAVISLAEGLPAGNEFGVVAFGTQFPATGTSRAIACADVTTPVPVGPLDVATLQTALDPLQAQGFTPIGTALQTAYHELPKNVPGSIVLVSDGESTCDPEPCAVAEQIHRSHPDIRISAVGLRTDAPSLACIAESGGGLFVTADNAAQLSARLGAAQNTEAAAERLSPTSRNGITIGQSLAEIRAANPSFPTEGRARGEQVVVIWIDCEYVFDGGVLIEIAPGNPGGSAGTTIDGVTVGTPGARAVELYGEPLEDSDGVAVFPADEAAGTAYRISYRDGSSIKDGTVTSVVLCRCMPTKVQGGSGDGPEVVRVVAVDKSGTPINGFTRGTSGSAWPTSEIEYCRAGMGAVSSGIYHCGTTADSAPNCWPGTGAELLCTHSPFSTALVSHRYSGTLPTVQPKTDPHPWALVLADGTECLIKFGGAWDIPPAGFTDVYSCSVDTGYRFVYTKNGSPDLFDKSGDDWTVYSSDGKATPVPTVVRAIYYSATE